MKKIVVFMFVAIVLSTSTMLFAADGNLRYSVSVSSFENKANWAGQANLGSAFATIMTDALQASGKFVVLADSSMRKAAMEEQDLSASGRTATGNKTARMGKMTPAQLLVKGAITHVQDGTSGKDGGIGFGGFKIGGKKSKAEINITIYLMDSSTGGVKASKSVVGTSEQKGLSVGANVGGLSAGGGGFENDNMGKAAESAIRQAVEFLESQLEGIAWEGTVVLSKPGKIMINRGSREGVQVGQTFIIGDVERIEDPDTGEVLDEEVITVGKIEVTRVKEKISICKALEGGDAIKSRMAVRVPE